jgi:hypothetical protein
LKGYDQKISNLESQLKTMAQNPTPPESAEIEAQKERREKLLKSIDEQEQIRLKADQEAKKAAAIALTAMEDFQKSRRASSAASARFESLKSLITDSDRRPRHFWGWTVKFTGLLLTVIACSLGAPFWFDLLKRFVNIRGAGLKPEDSTPAAKQ